MPACAVEWERTSLGEVVVGLFEPGLYRPAGLIKLGSSNSRLFT